MNLKPGTKVIIVEHNNITGVLSDNMLELADGADRPNQAMLEDALWNSKPLTIHHYEAGGYVLQLGKKRIYGLHTPDTFKVI